ncbi:MarR family winged helix-turn-helix transcriptional regulator [Spongiimicrobium sp. 3-5]|uniref:MarR family winged helix-turn-helix transcriptional regulator n=1 Tax=Spongiimicrobium sp. 3-5 TaxID=3332596 RepID=UPI00398079FE
MEPKYPIIDFDNSIAPWLGKTAKVVDYHLQEAFLGEGLDLSKEQMVVLKKLHHKNGMNQNELAFLTLRDKSSLARLLSKMERKGYIRREQSETDKRINHVYLSDCGREVFKRTRPIIKKLMSIMEQNITKEESNQMIATLQKIQFNLTSKKAFL